MPERVHTKFGEGLIEEELTTFKSSSHPTDKDEIAKPLSTKSTAIKRRADGSPKAQIEEGSTSLVNGTTVADRKKGVQGDLAAAVPSGTDMKKDSKKQKVAVESAALSSKDSKSGENDHIIVNGNVNEHSASSQATLPSSNTSAKRSADSGLVEVPKKRRIGLFEPPTYPSSPRVQNETAVPRKNYTNGLNNDRKGSIKSISGMENKSSDGVLKRPAQALLEKQQLALRNNVRKNLPIWSHQADIRWKLRHTDVLLLIGETGSGKSTQVPQFFLNEPWFSSQTVTVQDDEGNDQTVKVGGMVAITEPRRVAAISLAHRVAKENGSFMGPSSNKNDNVGYSVRFDSCVPANTKIKFLTEGMLLQELLRDPYLRKYSVVVVDEIHERGVDVDLLAGFLKNLVRGDKKGRGGVPLKLVIMSATANMAGLKKFFEESSGENIDMINGLHGAEEQANKEDTKSSTNDTSVGNGFIESRRSSNASNSTWEGCESDSDDHSLPENPIFSNPEKEDKHEKTDLQSSLVPTDLNLVEVEHIQGRQHPVEIFYSAEPIIDYVASALKTIFKIHTTEPLPGDILVFLTGQEEIENLQKSVLQMAEKLTKEVPRIEVLPLFGQQTIEQQQQAFAQSKEKKTRKVIIATNIAETSITVPGVRFVVDCGKSKVKEYRSLIDMSSLLVKPISKSSAIQRKGRAGREASGKCYRLYTEAEYLKAPYADLPEILRTDVVEAVLKMKARGIRDVLQFPLMDPPNPDLMTKALFQLYTLGALDEDGSLNRTGLTMSTFPLSASYARVLVSASQADCLLEAIDVIACLTSGDDIFVQPKSESQREETNEARRNLTRREGDVLTLLTVMQKFTAEPTGTRGQWCRQHFINIRNIKNALNIRRQLRSQCVVSKLLDGKPEEPAVGEFVPLSSERAEVLLKCFLRSFLRKTASIKGDGGYKTTLGRHQIAIHPSSALFGKKTESIMYLEHVFTQKSYAKIVSAVQANWIQEAVTGQFK